MLRMPNSGRKSLDDIKGALARMGLCLRMEVPGWPPENIEDLAKVLAKDEDVAKDKVRGTFLEAEIAAICQSLDDPWP